MSLAKKVWLGGLAAGALLTGYGLFAGYVPEAHPFTPPRARSPVSSDCRR